MMFCWISGERMLSTSRIRFLTAVVMVCALFCGLVTAGTLTHAIGDKVDLSGTAFTTNTMYLFVTGPGLDPNGVNPSQMKSPVVSGDPSTFVQVDVENDTWSYIWNTAHQGFSLKEGTYTIYAVDQPVAKNALPAVYGSIEIGLTQSGLSLPTSGTISITTSPPGAALYIDSHFVGNAPRSFTAPAGNHTLRIESPGYQTLVESLPVKGEGVIAIDKILEPVTTTPAAPMVSPTTHIPITTRLPVPSATATPTTPLPTGIGLLATACATLFWHYEKR
jgi:hypothetical protein